MERFMLKRSVPVEIGYDVVVAGAGPAGSAAAVCAARLGAKVLLVEAMGCMGGMGTSGLVAAFGPMSDGVRQLACGFIGEVVDILYDRGYIQYGLTPEAWRQSYLHWVPFNPEGLKIIYEEFAQAAGVDIRYFTRVIDVQLDPANDHRIDGVIISNVDGYSYIKAKAFVDCTGDAILAGLCGAKCREAYKDTPKGLAASLDSLWAGCDWEIAGQRVDEFKDLLDKAVGEGRFTQSDRLFRGTVKGSAVGIARLGKTTALLNAGHIYNMNALRNKDVTEAMIFGRRQLLEYWDFMRKDLPGMSGIDMIATGSLLGVRESRRIVGEYEITQEDFFEKRHFPDQIGAYNRMMDIHPYDDSPEELEKFRRNMERNQLGVGNYLGIPYGILVPKGWHNLWVAGRCVSTDPQVLGTLRAQPCCAIMGQAAGTAAVQAVRTGALAYRLDTDLLRDTLRNNGAYIPE